ncbi:MAG: hypothetical protein HHAS10_10080 [Candidatus Altimarinota bacterium]
MLKKVFLFIGIISSLSIIAWYLSIHASIYEDKIVLLGEEGDTLIVIEAIRTSILGIYYNHDYGVFGYINGKRIQDSTQFLSFKRDLSSHGFIREIQDHHDHENTKRSIAAHINFENNDIYFLSEDLVADMTLKTYTDYFRYGSLGGAKGKINHQESNFFVTLTTTVVHDGKYATLNPNTEADGYVGGFWEKENIAYFDRSFIRKYGPGEEYYEHNFGFHKNGFGISRVEGIDMNQKSSSEREIRVGEKIFSISRNYPKEESGNEKWYILEGPTGKGYINEWRASNSD